MSKLQSIDASKFKTKAEFYEAIAAAGVSLD